MKSDGKMEHVCEPRRYAGVSTQIWGPRPTATETVASIIIISGTVSGNLGP